jgi:hypothetical protein
MVGVLLEDEQLANTDSRTTPIESFPIKLLMSFGCSCLTTL